MRVLVDMDGVLAWWEKALIREVQRLHPDIPVIPFGTRTPDTHMGSRRPEVQAILDTPGFYRHLEPVAGGKAALEAMRAAGHEVLICTAPTLSNPTCGHDKYAWIGEYLGEAWINRTIVVFDKTLIDGDVLIDDRLHVRGARVPTWTHVLFDQSYNRVPDRLRMLDWAAWPATLAAVETMRTANESGRQA